MVSMNSTPPIFCAGAQIGGVLRQAHALHAAGGDDGAFAGADLLRGQRHGAQAGAADLVDAERGLGVRQAGGARGLAGRVLALAGGQHLAQDHLVHVAGLDAGALDRGLQRDGAELVRGQRAQARR